MRLRWMPAGDAAESPDGEFGALVDHARWLPNQPSSGHHEGSARPEGSGLELDAQFLLDGGDGIRGHPEDLGQEPAAHPPLPGAADGVEMALEGHGRAPVPLGGHVLPVQHPQPGRRLVRNHPLQYEAGGMSRPRDKRCVYDAGSAPQLDSASLTAASSSSEAAPDAPTAPWTTPPRTMGTPPARATKSPP